MSDDSVLNDSEKTNTKGKINGSDSSETVATNDDELKRLKDEVEKYKNDYLYLRAEFDNFRKNTIKERSDLIKYGSERFLREFLEVLDTLEMGLEAPKSPDSYEGFVKGIELTVGNLRSLLLKHGLVELSPQGEPFNPSMHEALSFEETSELPEGHITRVFKKAYKLHDKLIRPAQVVVAKSPSEAAK